MRLVHTSQSTVGYRLDRLEKRLGQTLVLRARGTKGIGLTPAGRRYLDLPSARSTGWNATAARAADAAALLVLEDALTELF